MDNSIQQNVQIVKPFENIFGHKYQKEELSLLLDWFNNYDHWKSQGISLPKGVLLYGEPGNGKSMIMKDIFKHSELPVCIFKGCVEKLCEALEDIFIEARKKAPSIILIDELDLLIDKDSRVTRILQDNIDGLRFKEDVFVIAATNDLDSIPYPLLRHGRLEKIIKISNPTGKEAFQYLRSFFEKVGATFAADIDIEGLTLTLENISFAGLKSIANDVVLRNGFKDIGFGEIIDSIYRVSNHVQDKNEVGTYESAIHEAGHAVLAHKHSKYFKITRLDIKHEGGTLFTKQVAENIWPYKKIIADIEISIAGVLAQKIIFKEGSEGCGEDLQRARRNAWNAFNYFGYRKCSDTLPEVRPYARSREEPEYKKESNIKRADSLLNKCERRVKRYLKKNKRLIIAIADELYEKKFLSAADVKEIINEQEEKAKFKFYETSWYFDRGDVKEDWETKSFKTKWGALKYYQKHKDDEGTYWWKVTKRTYGFKILETYIDEFKEKI